jgi:hypothetical protein
VSGNRVNGPWDATEVEGDGVERLDLGGLRVTAAAGVDVQVQVDETSRAVVQVTLARPDGGVQVQPYAAPRTGGLWDEVRPQIKASINAGGGLVEEVDGPFGIELKAQVKAEATGVMQPARFVGVEGPRWFLRAVFLGGAARPGETATTLEDMVRALVVVRGSEAMPVGSAIPMRLPEQQEAAPSATTPTLPSPFVRGPEITETR